MEIQKRKKTDSVKIKGICICIIPCLTVFLFFQTVILAAKIPSESMEPTIMTDERVIFNRLAYRNKKPDRYDIIVFYSPEKKNLLVKRIIGLPGDTVELKDGYVYVNDIRLQEQYLPAGTITKAGKKSSFHVPTGEYFVLGDNRNESYDSRFNQNPYVHKNNIKGKAVLKYNLLKNFHIKRIVFDG
jgi:signal peptidase I